MEAVKLVAIARHNTIGSWVLLEQVLHLHYAKTGLEEEGVHWQTAINQ